MQSGASSAFRWLCLAACLHAGEFFLHQLCKALRVEACSVPVTRSRHDASGPSRSSRRRSSSFLFGCNRSQSSLYLNAACSVRQLLQAGQGETTSFPGCTFLRDSEIATNPDFSTLYYNLQYTGLNNTLANLKSVVTLFAPTNEAFQQYVAAYNETGAQAMTEPPRGGEAAAFLVDGLELHTATEALPVLVWTSHCPNIAPYCSF